MIGFMTLSKCYWSMKGMKTVRVLAWVRNNDASNPSGNLQALLEGSFGD